MPFSTADMKVNGLATKGKVLDNPFGGKAVTAYCAGLAVCFFHKVTLIQPEVYLGNVLLDIYHIKIICEYLWKDTTQQLLGLHDAKITNTYEIMCMRGRGLQLGFTTGPKLLGFYVTHYTLFRNISISKLLFTFIYEKFTCTSKVFKTTSSHRAKNITAMSLNMSSPKKP